VADLVLLANVVLLTALLSMIARLAVAARYRRHHPHRRHGGGRQRADLRAHPREIAKACRRQAGDPCRLEKAFSAIADSNINADRRRGAVGVRHRADPALRIVLTLGIATSMFTSADGQPCAAHPSCTAGGARSRVCQSDRRAHPQGPAVEFFSHQTSYPFMATRRVWYTLSPCS